MLSLYVKRDEFLTYFAPLKFLESNKTERDLTRNLSDIRRGAPSRTIMTFWRNYNFNKVPRPLSSPFLN
jgi:hypothetical protein